MDEPSALAELRDFLRRNRVWWMVPAITVVVLVVLLAVGSASNVAPFFYTLF